VELTERKSAALKPAALPLDLFESLRRFGDSGTKR
jgi:hypothetical protein